MKTLEVNCGGVIIGGGHPVVVQTMCNTHTYDVEGTVAQCIRMAKAGAEIIRITVPGLREVEDIAAIKRRLREEGVDTPLVADIHFSSETAIAVASVVEKVRINPGNFHRDHEQARLQFARLLEVCKEHGTAIRIGLNHGSLGEYITNLYGNTPFAMAKAAMEWIEISRMNMAKSLLKQGERQIAEIAAAVGIDDQSYFTRFFKKNQGITPTQYRERILRGEKGI